MQECKHVCKRRRLVFFTVSSYFNTRRYSLRDNNIGSEGATALAELLKINTTVTTLM